MFIRILFNISRILLGYNWVYTCININRTILIDMVQINHLYSYIYICKEITGLPYLL